MGLVQQVQLLPHARMLAMSGNRTASGAPSATARAKYGGKGGKFPVFDHKSAMSALKLRGHSPDPASIIAKVRRWANSAGDKAVLAACDQAA